MDWKGEMLMGESVKVPRTERPRQVVHDDLRVAPLNPQVSCSRNRPLSLRRLPSRRLRRSSCDAKPAGGSLP
jgi:hypothetical protein